MKNAYKLTGHHPGFSPLLLAPVTIQSPSGGLAQLKPGFLAPNSIFLGREHNILSPTTQASDLFPAKSRGRFLLCS